jgi:hypothetical protein
VTGASSFSTISTSGAASLDSAAITNNASIGGTLGVTGATTLASLNAQASTLASASVTGNASIGGTLGVTGASSFSTISTSGAASLESAAITNDASVGGDFGVAGDATVSGMLTAASGNISGPAYVGGQFQVAGASTLASVTVSGAAVFNGGISADGGKFTISDETGDIHTDGDLSVNGVSELGVISGSAVKFTGDADLDGALDLAGAASFGSTMDVIGAAQFDSTISVKGDADFEGGVVVNSDATAPSRGDLRVAGIDITPLVDTRSNAGDFSNAILKLSLSKDAVIRWEVEALAISPNASMCSSYRIAARYDSATSSLTVFGITELSRESQGDTSDWDFNVDADGDFSFAGTDGTDDVHVYMQRTREMILFSDGTYN